MIMSLLRFKEKSPKNVKNDECDLHIDVCLKMLNRVSSY